MGRDVTQINRTGLRFESKTGCQEIAIMGNKGRWDSTNHVAHREHTDLQNYRIHRTITTTPEGVRKDHLLLLPSKHIAATDMLCVTNF